MHAFGLGRFDRRHHAGALTNTRSQTPCPSRLPRVSNFVTSVDEVGTVRSVRDEFVDTDRPPTSTLVQVAGLFRSDLVIEVEAVAWLP